MTNLREPSTVTVTIHGWSNIPKLVLALGPAGPRSGLGSVWGLCHIRAYRSRAGRFAIVTSPPWSLLCLTIFW